MYSYCIPSSVESVLEEPEFREWAPCPCDLTANVCDPGCCCDPDVREHWLWQCSILFNSHTKWIVWTGIMDMCSILWWKNCTCAVVENSTLTACVSPHELHGFACEPGVFGERALSCAYTGPERSLAPFNRLLCATALIRQTVLGDFYADERIVRDDSDPGRFH